MTIEVHTYSKPNEWEEHPLFSSFSGAVHICATRNQREGIESRYKKDLPHIYSFREFIKSLYPRWYSAETKFQQFLRLSKVIAELPLIKSELQQALRKNAMEILESIRYFTEAGIHPEALSNNWIETDKEQQFKRIWQLFIQDDNAVIDHYKALQRPVSEKNVQDAVLRLNKNQTTIPKELHIVLHGFYFITPEQQVIFELMRRKGIRITFFHYYDGRYANTFDFIKAFTTERFGWPSPDDWVYDSSLFAAAMPSAHSFLAAYEQAAWQPQPSKESIKAYGSFFDFLHDVILPNFPVGEQKENKEINAAQVISPNADDLNELVAAYYPELNAKNVIFYRIQSAVSL